MDREALKVLAAGRRTGADAAPSAKRIAWTCELCEHAFASEKTFMKHRCRGRERLDELQGQIGQAAYALYAEWMRASKRSVPPIETFAHSLLYTSFVKFARHVQRVQMPNTTGFVRTMIEHGNIQPSLWCRDNVYAMYLRGYDEIVPPEQQYLSSLELLHVLATEHGVPVGGLFDALGVGIVLDLVQRRKLSPWLLISSHRFREFMSGQDVADRDRLEAAIQVGAMVMRIRQCSTTAEMFSLFNEVSKKEGL